MTGDIAAQLEQPCEGLIHQLDAAVRAEDEDALDHAVEEHLPLGLRVGIGLLLLAQGVGGVFLQRRGLLPAVPPFAPPRVEHNQRDERDEDERGPHGVSSKAKGKRQKEKVGAFSARAHAPRRTGT